MVVRSLAESGCFPMEARVEVFEKQVIIEQ